MAGIYGNALTQRIGRLAEALEICERMSRGAERRNDKEAEMRWIGNRALILKAWGRLEEALALRKAEEALCLELGSNRILANSYGNQAVILVIRGQFEEALALMKKQENGAT